MGTYRNISLTFWTDAKVDDDFTPHEKYLYLYFLTNPHTNICGCYQIAQNQMTRETGLEWPEVEQLISRMQDVHKVLRYDPGTKEILLLNWGKYNWSRSPKVRDSVFLVVPHIRNQEFREYVIANAESRWEAAPPAEQDSGKKERSKEKTVNSIQDTVNSKQKTVTVYSNSNRKYGYPMDRVSEAEAEAGAEVEEETRKDADFERLWAAYPAARRVNRKSCRKAFDTVTVPIDELLDALERQKSSDEWIKQDGKYIPGMFKWISESRWEAAPPADGFVMGPEELESIRNLARLRDKYKEEQ